MKSSRWIAAVAVIVAFAAVAAVPALGGTRSRGYSLSATSHGPRAGARWTATVRGRAGRVSLDVVFGGQVVGHISTGALRRGRYRHTMRWEKRAIGYPMIVRATITGSGAPVRLEYPVKVRPA